MLPSSLRFRIPASVYRKKICLLFLSGSIGPTRHGPENPEPGLASRSRGGLRKRITPRFLSKVLWDRVQPLKFAFRCTRRFVAPCSAMNRNHSQAESRWAADKMPADIARLPHRPARIREEICQEGIVGKRRHFVGNEEIAFADE